MRIEARYPAVLCGDDDEELKVPLSVLKTLEGLVVSDEELSVHMDLDMAFIGLVGGEIQVEVAGDNRLNYRMILQSPRSLTEDELEQLREFAYGQFLDGAGECGLDVEIDGKEAHVNSEILASGDATTIVQIDDGVPVPYPNPVALCAAKGDLEGVIKALAAGESIEGCFLESPPLKHAIMSKSNEIVEELLRQGANPNGLGLTETSPLLLCAMNIDDASTEIAEMLLKHGADPHYQSPGGYTALYMAENRKKRKLAALLKRAMDK